jgi:hypothetical protein
VICFVPQLIAMTEWSLPTLFQVLAQEETLPGAKLDGLTLAQRQLRAERQWAAAVTALEQLLSRPLDVTHTHEAHTSHINDSKGDTRGIVLTGPVPVLQQPDLLKTFKSWTFTTDQSVKSLQLPFQLPAVLDAIWAGGENSRSLPLFPQDPLATEQFCLVMTAQFGVILLLSQDDQGNPRFVYSFSPDAVACAW